MKKRTLISLLLAVVMLFSLPTTAFSSESVDAPVLDIAAKNLSLNNTIDLVFYVTVENAAAADVRLMTWTASQTDYAYGTQEKILEPRTITTYNGKSCAMFYYTGLAAKQMADEIYVRAYTEKNGTKYFSDVDKYSILQYAYNKQNAATPDTKLVPLLNSMLDYGAQAQTYFNYNTERLANAEFYRIRVKNGLLSDQTDRGLYLAGESATMIAPAQNADGVLFSHWTNAAGATVGTSQTLTVTVANASETYTAVYMDWFAYTALNDGTYSIALKDTSVVNGTIEIPATYKGAAVTVIDENGFLNCTGLTSIVIPENITVIGKNAFSGCTALESLTFVKTSYWSAGALEFAPSRAADSAVMADFITDMYANKEWTYSATSSEGGYTKPY